MKKILLIRQPFGVGFFFQMNRIPCSSIVKTGWDCPITWW